MLGVVAVASVAGFAVGRASHAFDDTLAAALPAPSPARVFAAASEPVYLTPNFVADTAERVTKFVVNIRAVRSELMYVAEGSGSGFITHRDGMIMTNAHVVAGARELIVTLYDGRSFEGHVVSIDQETDVAVVKIDVNEALPTAPLCVKKPRVGEWVVAVGSPLRLQNSVSAGIVSAVDRDSNEIGLSNAMQYLQTDAAVNAGNSGGPLCNLQGEVVGICSMKAQAADGISFAIPIARAVAIVEQLSKHGRVLRPYIGAHLLSLDADVLRDLKERDARVKGKVFDGVSYGVLVMQTDRNSPAMRAGLQAGDVIVGIDGTPVKQTRDVLARVNASDIGTSLEFSILRHGKPMTVRLATADARAGM